MKSLIKLFTLVSYNNHSQPLGPALQAAYIRHKDYCNVFNSLTFSLNLLSTSHSSAGPILGVKDTSALTNSSTFILFLLTSSLPVCMNERKCVNVRGCFCLSEEICLSVCVFSVCVSECLYVSVLLNVCVSVCVNVCVCFYMSECLCMSVCVSECLCERVMFVCLCQ